MVVFQAMRLLDMRTISQQGNTCRWEILCRPEVRVGDAFTELGSLVAMRMIES